MAVLTTPPELRTRRRKSEGRAPLRERVPALALLLFLSVFIVIPVIVLVVVSFYTGQPGRLRDFTTDNWSSLFNGDLLPIIKNSIIYALFRTGGGLILALLFAWAVARTNVPGRRLMAICMPIPFLVPGLLVAMSWIFWANPQNGLLNQMASSVFGIDSLVNIYSWRGLIFLAIQGSTSFLFIMTLPFFYLMDPSHEEAAVTLGASRRRTFFTITIPMLAPAIIGAAILSFIRALETFEDPLLVGSPAGIYMFSNEIYRILKQTVGLTGPAYGEATVLSMVLIATTFALVGVQWRLLGSRNFQTVSGKGFRPRRIQLSFVARWSIFALFLVYFTVSVLMPGGLILLGSFSPRFGAYAVGDMTLQSWRDVFTDGNIMDGLKNTIIYSFVAGAVVVVLSGLVGYIRVRLRRLRIIGRALELVAWLPWTMPGLVLALALLWSFLLLPPPYNLYGTGTLVVIGFVIKGMPLGTRSMQSSIGQLSGELEEAARVHGASWLQSMRTVTIPLLRRGIFAAFVLIFALSARDLSIPILLYGAGSQTLTIALIEYYYNGEYTVVSAVAVIQLVIIFVLVAAERLSDRRQLS